MIGVSEVFRFALHAMRGARLRAMLLLLAVAIGVASVVVLTGLGEGARRYVLDQFQSLGSHLLFVLPGRSETVGGPPPLLGGTPRPLTIDDALALRQSRYIKAVAPIIVGGANVSFRQRQREAIIVGTTRRYLDIRQIQLAQGRNLPAIDPHRAASVCIIGVKLRNELFGTETSLGQWLKIGDRRYRVIGVLKTEGRSLGIDVEELALIPVAAASTLFNTDSLFRILVQARSRDAIEPAREAVRRILTQRHEGEEDITVITQDAVVSAFDNILRALTYTVTGIAAISLIVAGVLIMNVMLVAVSQRMDEIGLLKALGATPRNILSLFLAEAAMLSLTGAVLGLIPGYAVSRLLMRFYPTLDLTPPWWSIVASLTVAIGSGLLFGYLPARRAARMPAVQALMHH